MTTAPEAPTDNHSVALERAIEAIRAGEENRLGHIREYLNVLSSGMEELRIGQYEGAFDDAVVASIENFIPRLAQFTELLSVITQYEADENYANVLHKFFEDLIPYLYLPKGFTGNYSKTDQDNFRFIIHELFLYTVAILLKEEKFEAAHYLISNNYYSEANARRGGDIMASYVVLYQNMESIRTRNKRLEPNRISLHVDILEKRTKHSGIDFKYLMQADFILFARKEIELGGFGNRWYPMTLNYFYWGDHEVFEIFVRAESAKYFHKIKSLIGINDTNDMIPLSEAYSSGKIHRLQIDHSGIHLEPFMNFDKLATKP